jgi:uncharacterized protein (DUF1697 family)
VAVPEVKPGLYPCSAKTAARLGAFMTKYIALLRAVNVGGTGKLPMVDLKRMCTGAGFTRIETYIASGNVIFESKSTASHAKAALEAQLQAYASKPIGVLIRTASEMERILKANPFRKADPRHTYAIFLDYPPPHDALDQARSQTDEQMWLGGREIFVHYPRGMGRSKLRIPAAKNGTARNMNTVARLAHLASKP